MPKKKRIKLRQGYSTKLAQICGVSRSTVVRALGWNSDCDTENLIRKKAYDLGFVRQF